MLSLLGSWLRHDSDIVFVLNSCSLCTFVVDYWIFVYQHKDVSVSPATCQIDHMTDPEPFLFH